jgi:hypothetical protein
MNTTDNTTTAPRGRRYKVEHDWHAADTETHTDMFGDTWATVTTEFATVVDTRTGDTFQDGARRVTVKANGKTRRRTFIGETAWSDAKRWIWDVL